MAVSERRKVREDLERRGRWLEGAIENVDGRYEKAHYDKSVGYWTRELKTCDYCLDLLEYCSKNGIRMVSPERGKYKFIPAGTEAGDATV
jgi:hypothetical protein